MDILFQLFLWSLERIFCLPKSPAFGYFPVFGSDHVMRACMTNTHAAQSGSHARVLERRGVSARVRLLITQTTTIN